MSEEKPKNIIEVLNKFRAEIQEWVRNNIASKQDLEDYLNQDR